MKVVKLLCVNGSHEPNAALINDVDQEYPVFLESLHNGVYFNGLLDSGYVLTGMPYNFVKDGNCIMQLPVESYTPTPEEEEFMYNCIGAKLPYDEIRSHIDDSVAVSRPTPPTNYTIHSRKELLDYLDMVNSVSLEDDFRPLNYFVAPEARLTIQEYRSPEYARYVDIINNRRVMSLQKYYKLYNWLLQFGMSDRAVGLDVIDAYFAWGVDGVEFPIIKSYREMRDAELTAGSSTIPVWRKAIGFIDSKGNIFTSPEDAGIHWELPSNSPTYLQDVTAQIPINDSVASELRCRVKRPLTTLESTQFNVYYTADRLVMLKVQYPTLRVTSPISMGTIPLELASPCKKQQLFEHCYIEALANFLYNKRRCKVKVSSYKALSVVGMNPSTAMNYIATQDGMDKASVESDNFTVMDYDIAAFLSGETVSEQISDYLHGIVDGIVNIDSVSMAKEAESHVSIASTFSEIYALHHVMGIPLDEIYNKFNAITDDDKVIVFSCNEYNHTVQVSPLRLSLNGYLTDVQNYDLKCSRDCEFFYYISNVAREVGVNECDRHVGIEFYLVAKRGPVKDIVREIENFYVDKVNSTVSSASEREQLLALSGMFCLSRFFELALNGTCTLPDILGGTKYSATYEQQSTLAKHIARKIENLTTYCSYTVGGSTAKDMALDMYCVNAYVTPERVIPRKGYKIHEAAFYALWNDYSRTAPELHAQLVGLGVLPKGFQAWSNRYFNEQFVTRDIFDTGETNSLIYYNSQAMREQKHFPSEYVFKSVPHPIEYMFPGLYADAEEPERLSVPRQGEPIIRLGYTRELTLEDMQQYLYPSELIEEADQYMVAFHGLSADGFAMCSDIIDRVPTASDICVTVCNDGEHVYLPNEDITVNFRSLTQYMSEYGIVHLYDRLYLFYSSDGQLWEAKI